MSANNWIRQPTHKEWITLLTLHQHTPSQSSLFHLLQSCHNSQWCWDDQALPTHAPTVGHTYTSDCPQQVFYRDITTNAHLLDKHNTSIYLYTFNQIWLPSCHLQLSIFTDSIMHSAKWWILSYSGCNFEFLCPAGVTCCNDGVEFGIIRSSLPCQI